MSLVQQGMHFSSLQPQELIRTICLAMVSVYLKDRCPELPPLATGLWLWNCIDVVLQIDEEPFVLTCGQVQDRFANA